MDVAEARALFDRQLRAGAADTLTTRIERTARVVREVSRSPQGWAAVTWSDLDETTADAEIEAQLAYFRAIGRRFEWKLYDGDAPPDLADRLQASGFRPDDPEALMIADIDDLELGTRPPDGVEIVEANDEQGVDLLCRVSAEVFGHSPAGMREGLVDQLRADSASLSIVLALAGGTPISSARTEFHTGTQFAGLWGGGTLPAWRGRGVYRSMVAFRARDARARGFRHLRVDAMPDSEPILLRLGFVRAGTTTPYQSPPDECAATEPAGPAG